MGKYSKRRRSIETDPKKIYIQKALKDLRYIIIIIIPNSITSGPAGIRREVELYLSLCQAVISQIRTEENVIVIVDKIQWLIEELEINQSRVSSLNTVFSYSQKKHLSELLNKIKKDLSQIITDLSYSTDKSTYSSVDLEAYEKLITEMYTKEFKNNPEIPLDANLDNSDNNVKDTNIVYTTSLQPGQGTETNIRYLFPLDKICIPPYTTQEIDDFAIEMGIIDKDKKYLLGPKKKGSIIGFHTALRDNDAFLEKSIESLNNVFGERYGVRIKTVETHTEVYNTYYKATSSKIKEWLESKKQ